MCRWVHVIIPSPNQSATAQTPGPHRPSHWPNPNTTHIGQPIQPSSLHTSPVSRRQHLTFQAAPNNASALQENSRPWKTWPKPIASSQSNPHDSTHRTEYTRRAHPRSSISQSTTERTVVPSPDHDIFWLGNATPA